jgi:glucose/arabinose dehydrogenase
MPAPAPFSAEGARPPRPRRRALALLALAVSLGACARPPAAPPTAPPAATAAPAVAATAAPRQPVAGGPTLLRDDIALRRVASAGAGSIRLAVSPADGALYALTPGAGLNRVDPASGAVTLAIATADLVGPATPSGMAFGPDGTLYVVANRAGGARNKGLVRRGSPADKASWATVAETEPYPLSGTQFDHLFNGIAVSPDGMWLFVNSGSRTDHGEVQTNSGNFPNTREVALSARIFRIPADADGLRLPNDEAAVAPYVFARGTRNAYDLAFAPNGDLFAVDNGPDADLPDELNWVREGQHYGFPWRFGAEPNPVTVAGFDPSTDGRLSQDFVAVQKGLYVADPAFPPPPMAFTDPVGNRGPAAAVFRGADGVERDAAAAGALLSTFTPHRSPLGLVFVADDALPADLRGGGAAQSALVLSWGAAGGDLSDKGQDLLHMALTREGERYVAATRQIARDFKHPMDAVLIDNRLYVLEFDGDSTIWELAFQP